MNIRIKDKELQVKPIIAPLLSKLPSYSRSSWIYLFPCILYFFLSSIPQARMLHVGPASIVVIFGMVGAINLGVIAVKYYHGYILSSRIWILSFILLFISFLIGLIQTQPEALPSTIYNIILFCIPLAIISFMPSDGRHLRTIGLAWLLGMGVSALFQINNEIKYVLVWGGNPSSSLSRMIFNERTWEIARSQGIQNNLGCMAMSIGASCCYAILLKTKSKPHIVGLLLLTFILMIGQSLGQYMATTIILVFGFILALIFTLSSPKIPGQMHIIILSVVIIFIICILALSYFGYSNMNWRLNAIIRYGIIDDLSIFSRYEGLAGSVRALISSPLYGIGFQGWLFESSSQISGHSSIFDVPAQLGVIGSISYYGFTLLLIYKVHRWRNTSAFSEYGISNAILVGLYSYLLASILDPVFLQPSMNEAFLICAGLGITLITYNKAPLSINRTDDKIKLLR